MALSRFVLPFADVGGGIRPSSGAKLFFYATGTSTPATTFSDSVGSTPNTNPVIAGANGVFPNIFINGIFKAILKDKNDVQIWEADPVSGIPSIGTDFDQVPLNKNIIKPLDTIADLRATEPVLANQRISTSGHTTIGLGGSEFYWHQADTTSADNNGTIIVTPGGKRWKRLSDGRPINISMFGAVGDWDGSTGTDNTVAINAALAASPDVHADDGVFAVTTLNKTTSGSITGQSRDGTIIQGISAVAGSEVLLVEGPAPTQIANLGANVAQYDEQITLASPTTVAMRDLFLIINETDGSFNPARTNYRAGEILTAQGITGNVISLADSAIAPYAIADVDVYKMNSISVTLRNISILKSESATTGKGVRFRCCRDSLLDNVTITGGDHYALSISLCHEVNVTNSSIVGDFNLPLVGLNYGIAIGNSQNINISKSNIRGRRHGITTGGGDDLGIPCRYITVDNNIIFADSLQSLDMHGNSEFFKFTNNTIEKGIVYSGDNHTISGNLIQGVTVNGSAVIFSEIIGLNLLFDSNDIKAKSGAAISGRGLAMDNEVMDLILRNSICNITNNVINIDDSATTSTGNQLIRFQTASASTHTNLVEFNIKNNTLRTVKLDSNLAIFISNLSSNPLKSVSITNNSMSFTGIELVKSIETVVIQGNTIINPSNSAIYAQDFIGDTFDVSSNIITGAANSGVFFDGNSRAEVNFLNVSGNTIKDCNRLDGGSSTLNSSVFMGRVKQIKYFNNFTGSGSAFQARDYYVLDSAQLNVGSNVILTGSSATVTNSADATVVI
jgi:hypothetical protein